MTAISAGSVDRRVSNEGPDHVRVAEDGEAPGGPGRGHESGLCGIGAKDVKLISMRIGVLGTGEVGKRLAKRFAEVGHEAMIGTRDPAATRAREGWDSEVPLGTFAEAAAYAEVVVNAMGGNVTIENLSSAGAENLNGKVLIDISNSLDFSNGYPPMLFVKDTDSMGEMVQREFPHAKVVKTLNTVNNSVMAYPEQVNNGDHTMFVCGNDAEAKTVVSGLLREFGWRDIMDVGGIEMSRGPEMYLGLWARLYPGVGHGNFNIKVVR
jgi:predicted dinucleotide-binding enzyme